MATLFFTFCLYTIFIFFIRSAKDKSEVEKIAKEIINTFDAMFVVGGKKVDYVTASLGIALIPQDGKDFQTIYNCADDAMYSAKNSGKNNYKFYDKNMGFHIYEESVKKKEIEG
jgi:diguanylate cyclase (GGDEF)-like protein